MKRVNSTCLVRASPQIIVTPTVRTWLFTVDLLYRRVTQTSRKIGNLNNCSQKVTGNRWRLAGTHRARGITEFPITSLRLLSETPNRRSGRKLSQPQGSLPLGVDPKRRRQPLQRRDFTRATGRSADWMKGTLGVLGRASTGDVSLLKRSQIFLSLGSDSSCYPYAI